MMVNDDDDDDDEVCLCLSLADCYWELVTCSGASVRERTLVKRRPRSRSGINV